MPNLIAVGSAIARQKHEFDSDFALDSDGATLLVGLPNFGAMSDSNVEPLSC